MRGAAAVLLVLFLAAVPANQVSADAGIGTREPDPILRVGVLTEMLTRNVLSTAATTPETEDVLMRVYDSVLLSHPTLDRPMAYIAKGVDVDEDGMFEPSIEYDQWTEEPTATTPLNVTVYYDFNGVRWHDGTQVTVWDLFFSYHVAARHPRWNNTIRALLCDPTATYDACGRQLRVSQAAKSWEGESTMPGDANLRVAVRFSLAEPFARFAEQSLRPLLLPMHLWSRTGGGTHGDFGCAIWIPPSEASSRGLAECGSTNAKRWGSGIDSSESVPGSRPYSHDDASRWVPTDADVVGHGPFRFQSWVPAMEAEVVRNDDVYTGRDPMTDVVFDARLAAVFHKPTIGGIRFILYRTPSLLVLALQNDEIDVIRRSIPPEFVPDLLHCCSEVTIEANPDPGFAYLAYNLRREPWGYRNGNTSDDAGYWLRQALAHVVDRTAFCWTLLLNLCIRGVGPVSPANTFWYNDGVPKPFYDLSQATAILDAHGFGPDPPGPCDRTAPSGCRNLPRIGQGEFWILTPQADYDAVRASAGAIIAAAMRQIGLNANARPTWFAEIMIDFTTAQYRRDFDIIILDWQIHDVDPDYLFRLFHSTNAPSGDNYPGIVNASMDDALDDSRRAMDRDARRDAVFRAEDVFADARPYEVLYYPTNLEAYRNARFVNWTVRFGTIWNYWSLLGIRPPATMRPLLVGITAESAIVAGTSTPVTVRVYDGDVALTGATVRLDASAGTVAPETGVTDSSGRLVASFTAPDVSSTSTVILSATASHPDFRDAGTAQTIVIVFPPGERFLSLTLELPLGDRVLGGSTLPMAIEVRDETGSAVGDASVTISTSKPGLLAATPANGTASELAQIVLRASSSNARGSVQVGVTAQKPGHSGAQGFATVFVLPGSAPPPPPPPSPTPNDEGPMILLGVFAAVGATAAGAWMLLRWAQRKRLGREP